MGHKDTGEVMEMDKATAMGAAIMAVADISIFDQSFYQFQSKVRIDLMPLSAVL